LLLPFFKIPSQSSGRTIAMVQVDVFWSYAFGASLAAAAHRQLETEVTPSRSGFFVKNLLFLSCLFGPSGIYLLWRFPGWETMFVFGREIPAWLVTLFAITNVTQGVLGFFVAYGLIRRQRIYLAHLQWVFGYLAMFFVLVHGWDGTGFRRFLYSGTIDQFRAGVAIPWYKFFTSDVALTLYVMGLILLPVLFWMIARWLHEGYAQAEVEPSRRVPALEIVQRFLLVTLVYTLGAAIVASVLVHLLGWLWGLGLFFILYTAIWLRHGGLVHRQIAAITADDRV
jgi:hypothetical protein